MKSGRRGNLRMGIKTTGHGLLRFARNDDSISRMVGAGPCACPVKTNHQPKQGNHRGVTLVPLSHHEVKGSP